MHFSRYSSATDIGLQRSNNEDCFLNSPEHGLWLVADGMGGHAAGEVASAIVASTIEAEVGRGRPLKDAVLASHTAVLQAVSNGQGGQGMGSTVVALRAQGEMFKIAWVGDSRAYLWRPGVEPSLTQLSVDHSYVQMLYQSGAISEDELETHPEKNIITQCLGSTELEAVVVDEVEGQWYKQDRIILCSDGLSDAVPSRMISDILSKSANTRTATKLLIEAALSLGGKDNITVTVVEYPGSFRNLWLKAKASFKKLLD